MKVLLSFTILALVASAFSEPDCSPGQPEHQPHPTDCNKYYTCSNGDAVLQECPPGLWWSVAMDTCDLPENTDCDAGVSTTTVASTTTGTTASSTTTGTGTTSTAAPTTQPPPVNKCPPVEDPAVTIRYPHETNCEFYYKCEQGRPSLYTCPPGEQFSPTKRFCYLNTVAGCDSCPTVEDPTDIVRLPHETNCHFYYLCQAGQPNLFQCQLDLHFSRMDRVCMSQADAKCTLSKMWH